MGLKLDAPVATNALDSSGEILSIKGLDITDFIEGKAVANWEHSNSSEDGAVGRFIYAKKIFSEKDCENERQLNFWNQLNHEFLYGVVELYDEEEHPGAVAIAAMVRHFVKKGEKLRVGMSIEGATLERKGNVLQRAVARKAAITLTPCNKECWAELYGDEEVPVAKTESVEVSSFDLDMSFSDLMAEVQILEKTLTAGMANVAPSDLTGGAALAKEHVVGAKLNRTQTNKLKAAVRDWDKTRPLKEIVKAALPEVTDHYVDHFVDLARELRLQKGEDASELVRIDPDNGQVQVQSDISEKQKALITGVYVNPKEEQMFGRNDIGQKVRVLPDSGFGPAYYRLMEEVFGLGQYIPTMVGLEFQGKMLQATEVVDGELTRPDFFREKVAELKLTGDFYKILLADYILGHESVRSPANTVFDGSQLFFCDNECVFGENSSPFKGHENDLIPSEVQNWLRNISPIVLIYQASLCGVPKQAIVLSKDRLMKVKECAHVSTLGAITQGPVC